MHGQNHIKFVFDYIYLNIFTLLSRPSLSLYFTHT